MAYVIHPRTPQTPVAAVIMPSLTAAMDWVRNEAPEVRFNHCHASGGYVVEIDGRAVADIMPAH